MMALSRTLLMAGLVLLATPFASRATGATLLPLPNPGNDDRFGNAVAMLGTDKALVAASDVGVNGFFAAGRVYLFNAGTGALLQSFTNPAPGGSDRFGASVASLTSEQFIVGAQGDDTPTNIDPGAAYLYNINSTAPQLTFFNPTPQQGDEFGHSVASVGNARALVGAYRDNTSGRESGAAYLFNAGNGSLLRTFLNPNPSNEDFFGFSVTGVGNDKVLIGAMREDSGALDAGIAYLFDANTGQLLHTINNPSPASGDLFGEQVAAVGDNAFVIAARADDTGASNAGAAYVFDATTGQLLHTLLNPQPGTDDFFGDSVGSISGGIVAVGSARNDAAGTDSGSVYLFDAATGTLLETINNPDLSSLNFGAAVSAGGPGLAIGAPFGAGQAYVLVPEPTCFLLLAIGVVFAAIAPRRIIK